MPFKLFGVMKVLAVARTQEDLKSFSVQAAKAGADLGAVAGKNGFKLEASEKTLYFRAKMLGFDIPNGNGDAIPRKYAADFGPSFIGKILDVNHQTDPEHIIGKILTTFFVEEPLTLTAEEERVIGRNVLSGLEDAEVNELQLEGICMIDRTTALGDDIAKKLISGILTMVSQEATTEWCQCSICGHKLDNPFAGVCAHLDMGSLMVKAYEVEGKKHKVLAYKEHHNPVGTGLGVVTVGAYSKADVMDVVAKIDKGVLKPEEGMQMVAFQESLYGPSEGLTEIKNFINIVAGREKSEAVLTAALKKLDGAETLALMEKFGKVSATRPTGMWEVTWLPSTSDSYEIKKGFRSEEEAHAWVKAEDLENKSDEVFVEIEGLSAAKKKRGTSVKAAEGEAPVTVLKQEPGPAPETVTVDKEVAPGPEDERLREDANADGSALGVPTDREPGDEAKKVAEVKKEAEAYAKGVKEGEKPIEEGSSEQEVKSSAIFFGAENPLDAYWVLADADGKPITRVTLGALSGGRLDQRIGKTTLAAYLPSETYGKDILSHVKARGLAAIQAEFEAAERAWAPKKARLSTAKPKDETNSAFPKQDHAFVYDRPGVTRTKGKLTAAAPAGKSITVNYEIVSYESAEQGEAEELGEEEVLEFDPSDEEGAVAWAIKELKGHGVEYSDSRPDFTGGYRGWYTTIDAEEDYRTGDRTTYSYHLNGFTPEEEKAIYEGVVGKVKASAKAPKASIFADAGRGSRGELNCEVCDRRPSVAWSYRDIDGATRRVSECEICEGLDDIYFEKVRKEHMDPEEAAYAQESGEDVSLEAAPYTAPAQPEGKKFDKKTGFMPREGLYPGGKMMKVRKGRGPLKADRYKSDEDIAKEFEGLKVQEVRFSNDAKTSGLIIAEFPTAGEHVGGGQEGPAEISDSFIEYANGDIAFDNWYPQPVVEALRKAIRDAKGGVTAAPATADAPPKMRKTVAFVPNDKTEALAALKSWAEERDIQYEETPGADYTTLAVSFLPDADKIEDPHEKEFNELAQQQGAKTKIIKANADEAEAHLSEAQDNAANALFDVKKSQEHLEDGDVPGTLEHADEAITEAGATAEHLGKAKEALADIHADLSEPTKESWKVGDRVTLPTSGLGTIVKLEKDAGGDIVEIKYDNGEMDREYLSEFGKSLVRADLSKHDKEHVETAKTLEKVKEGVQRHALDDTEKPAEVAKAIKAGGALTPDDPEATEPTPEQIKAFRPQVVQAVAEAAGVALEPIHAGDEAEYGAKLPNGLFLELSFDSSAKWHAFSLLTRDPEDLNSPDVHHVDYLLGANKEAEALSNVKTEVSAWAAQKADEAFSIESLDKMIEAPLTFTAKPVTAPTNTHVRADYDEEEEESGPQEDDITIGEDGRSASASGKEIVSISKEDWAKIDEAGGDTFAALARGIKKWMDENSFFPDVWSISDHGNTNNISQEVIDEGQELLDLPKGLEVGAYVEAPSNGFGVAEVTNIDPITGIVSVMFYDEEAAEMTAEGGETYEDFYYTDVTPTEVDEHTIAEAPKKKMQAAREPKKINKPSTEPKDYTGKPCPACLDGKGKLDKFGVCEACGQDMAVSDEIMKHVNGAKKVKASVAVGDIIKSPIAGDGKVISVEKRAAGDFVTVEYANGEKDQDYASEFGKSLMKASEEHLRFGGEPPRSRGQRAFRPNRRLAKSEIDKIEKEHEAEALETAKEPNKKAKAVAAQ